MTTKTIGLLALLVPALSAAEPEKPKKVQREVSVRLSFSVDEYEPARPSKAVMKCIARNDSFAAVHVPVGFDGGYVRVQSRGLNLVKNKRAKDDVKLAWLEPGQEQVVFELPLDDILLGAGKKDSVWYWNWMRRPAPPPSPIYKSPQKGLMDQVAFTVTIDFGANTLTSEAAILKVKPGEVPPKGDK